MHRLIFRTLFPLVVAFFLMQWWSNAALASTATVDGITFTTGTAPGGNVLQIGNVDQTGISGPGQQLEGVGTIEAITNAGGLNTTWIAGQNNVELVFEYTGYTSDVVVAPTNFAPGTVTFTGGSYGFYELPAGTNIATGTVAGDIAKVESGRLFLSQSAAIDTAQGDTLTEIVPATETLESFSAASSFGYLDVTGGDAAAYFNTNTYADAFDTANGGFGDESFTQSFSSGTASDGFSDSGSLTFNANATAVPEPTAIVAFPPVALALIRRKRTAPGLA